MILVLVGPDLDQLARDYATAVDHVLWEDLGVFDRAGDHLRGPQITFLKAAHGKLG